MRRAAELDVPFLGEVPINIGIRERGDAGQTSGNYSTQRRLISSSRFACGSSVR